MIAAVIARSLKLTNRIWGVLADADSGPENDDVDNSYTLGILQPLCTPGWIELVWWRGAIVRRLYSIMSERRASWRETGDKYFRQPGLVARA
jgi:hypothetical protein